MDFLFNYDVRKDAAAFIEQKEVPAANSSVVNAFYDIQVFFTSVIQTFTAFVLSWAARNTEKSQ